MKILFRFNGIGRAALAAVVAGSAFLVSQAAMAQPAKATDGDGEGYGYEFADDPLSAGGLGPTDATIRVRPGPVRRTLIKPRTSFVPEMYKSVEQL